MDEINYLELVNNAINNINQDVINKKSIYEKRVSELSKLRNSLNEKIYTLEEVLEWYNSFDKDKYGNIFDIEEFETDANYTKSYASNNWKTEETITFDFDIMNTIFGGKRLCIKEKNTGQYFTNWCFGKNLIELKRCLDWMKTLDEWTIFKFKHVSKSKPLQYDDEFVHYLYKLGFEVNPHSIKNLLNL